MEPETPALILAGRRRALTGSSRDLSRGYNAGALIRVRTGAYSSKAAWLRLKPWQRYAMTVAAVAALNPTTVFCYLTALRIWGLPTSGVPLHVHVITSSPHKAGREPARTNAAKDAKTGLTGLENVRGYGINRHYWPANIAQHGGYNVTSLLQTVMDSIVRMELPEAIAVADAVLGAHRQPLARLTPLDLHDAAALLPSASKRLKVERILALANQKSESVGESRSRAMFYVLGLPEPVLQHSFADAEGFIGRTDFFWPELGVIGEFDGDAKYLDDKLLGGQSTQEAVLAEKKREDRLRAQGYKVVRWDWKTLSKPELLRQKLAGAGVLPQKSPPCGLVPPA